MSSRPVLTRFARTLRRIDNQFSVRCTRSPRRLASGTPDKSNTNGPWTSGRIIAITAFTSSLTFAYASYRAASSHCSNKHYTPRYGSHKDLEKARTSIVKEMEIRCDLEGSSLYEMVPLTLNHERLSPSFVSNCLKNPSAPTMKIYRHMAFRSGLRSTLINFR